MAGADGQQLSPLRDARRWAWAASFMSRLFAPAAQLPAEEDGFSCGGGDSLYRSVSTVEDDGELGADADEPEEQLLAADEGEDPRRARSVCAHSLSHGAVQHAMSSTAHELRRRLSTDAALPLTPAMENKAESEPLMFRRQEAKRANDVVEAIDNHPFGCGQRERESSSLLLLSS